MSDEILPRLRNFVYSSNQVILVSSIIYTRTIMLIYWVSAKSFIIIIFSTYESKFVLELNFELKNDLDSNM